MDIGILDPDAAPAVADAPATSPDTPGSLPQLHDALIQQFTSDDFLSQHPSLPHPQGTSARGFTGDASIQELAHQIGDAYQSAMEENGASLEDIGQSRPIL